MKLSKGLAVAGIAAAAAFPALASAKGGHGHGHGQAGQHGQQAEQHGQAGKHGAQGKGQSKPRTYEVKGTVSAVNGNVVTVDVNHANHHGAGLVGQSIQFDLSSARVVGRAHDPSGVKVDDRVLVQARLPRDLTGLQQPYAARKLVDRGPKPQPQSTQQDQNQTDAGGDGQSDS
jgi:hypothetical protein